MSSCKRLSRLPSCSIALSIKPTCDSTVAKSCKSETASAYDFPNNRMSSAKRRSSSAGWLSPKSNPLNGASRLQPFIAHCSTAENKRGLKTHPYLTPEAMGKLRLDLHAMTCTSPDWPSYSVDSIHMRAMSKKLPNAHGQMPLKDPD